MWKNIAPTKTWSQEESRELSIVSPKLPPTDGGVLFQSSDRGHVGEYAGYGAD